jgi:tRNA U34 2-thiouridine synthase MnmA/TrmU
MEQNRFVKIKEMRIAVADIRRIIPAKEDKNMLETMISPLSDVQKNQVREIAKNWKMSNKHKDLTE